MDDRRSHDDSEHSHGEDDCGDDPCERCGERPSIFRDDRAQLRRRTVAKGFATVGGLTAVGSLAAPLSSLTRVFERSYSGPIYGQEIYLVDGDGERITEDRLENGERMTVFPEPRPDIEKAPTLLVRYPEDDYADDTALEHTVGGYAAFSKVCTHMGCMVDEVEGDTLICPCHYGEFDPLDGAAVVGGPPPRALPQLPLTLTDDGYLIATGDFLSEVGAE